MGELLSAPCQSCGEPMVPNVSTLDRGACGWICINPACPELAAGELEAEDLVEAGVPPALADRLARLIARYVDAVEAPPPAESPPRSALERLRREVHAVERMGREAAHTAGRLSAAVHVTHLSDDFDRALAAREDLAVVAALCSLAGRTARYARLAFEDIDPALPGLAARES